MNRIVFGSANHWTSPYQVGSHAWARLFSKHDWQTTYISDPITPWHLFSKKNRPRFQERYALWRKGGEYFENKKLMAWTPCSLIAPQSFSFFCTRWVLNHWDLFSVPSMKKQIRCQGFDSPDILWLDSVRHWSWGKKIKPKYIVLRIADWTAGFSTLPRSILEMEKELIQTADLVISSAKTLELRIQSLRGDRPLYTIRNGVDCAFWMNPTQPPLEYQEIPSPRAVYVGALDEWFDLPLALKMAQAMPSVSFVFIGQPRWKSPFQNLPRNIYFLGSRPRDQVRAYLQHAQIGIIPFKRSELIECVCPLKLYEYMACGLPVVSTRWEELENMNSPARLASHVDEWILHLTELLKNPSLSSKKNCLDYALLNDWNNRWKEWEHLRGCNRSPPI